MFRCLFPVYNQLSVFHKLYQIFRHLLKQLVVVVMYSISFHASVSNSITFDHRIVLFRLFKISKIDAFKNDGKTPSSIVGNIELKNVSFTYPAREDAPVNCRTILVGYLLLCFDFTLDSEKYQYENSIRKNCRFSRCFWLWKSVISRARLILFDH